MKIQSFNSVLSDDASVELFNRWSRNVDIAIAYQTLGTSILLYETCGILIPRKKLIRFRNLREMLCRMRVEDVDDLNLVFV